MYIILKTTFLIHTRSVRFTSRFIFRFTIRTQTKNPHLTKVKPLKAVEKDFKGIATPNSFGNKKNLFRI